MTNDASTWRVLKRTKAQEKVKVPFPSRAVSMFAQIFASLRFQLTCLVWCCTRAQTDSGFSLTNCVYKKIELTSVIWRCRAPNCLYFKPNEVIVIKYVKGYDNITRE